MDNPKTFNHITGTFVSAMRRACPERGEPLTRAGDNIKLPRGKNSSVRQCFPMYARLYCTCSLGFYVVCCSLCYGLDGSRMFLCTCFQAFDKASNCPYAFMLYDILPECPARNNYIFVHESSRSMKSPVTRWSRGRSPVAQCPGACARWLAPGGIPRWSMPGAL